MITTGVESSGEGKDRLKSARAKTIQYLRSRSQRICIGVEGEKKKIGSGFLDDHKQLGWFEADQKLEDGFPDDQKRRRGHCCLELWIKNSKKNL